MEILASNKKQMIALHDEPDIISKLPDSIIGYILSYLPTKYAVRTSVLSKEWESKWTHITNLSIEDAMSEQTRENRQRFVNFVNRVLQNLSSKKIHTFNLHLSRLFSRKENQCYSLPEWILSTLNLEVENLCVEYITNKRYNLSISLLPCTSLVHLELNIYCNLILYSSNCFRNLKIMKLSKIRFVGDRLSNQDVVLNFPALKLFYAKYCSWSNVKSIIIEAPLLEKVSLVFQSEDNNEPWSPTFKVLSMNLKTFYYIGNLVEDIILSNPFSVVHAWVNVNRSAKACKFLQQFRGVSFLKLSSTTIQGLRRDEVYASTLPMFQSLIHLALELSSSFPYEDVLMNLLDKTPILKNLEIAFDFDRPDKNIVMPKNLPYCFLSSLKDATISTYNCCANSLSLTKYILEHTKVMEKLTIKVPVSKKGQVRKELQIPNALNPTILQVEKIAKYQLACYLYSFHFPLII
ncbi:hypothetical protein RIF29_08581 [Crotalaria pallida]|uniref:F-box domain-containing protein n=1 Tax=Crotalaria pallida TaxID=3830 RepID=A0AAN9IHE2_CROPI